MRAHRSHQQAGRNSAKVSYRGVKGERGIKKSERICGLGCIEISIFLYQGKMIKKEFLPEEEKLLISVCYNSYENENFFPNKVEEFEVRKKFKSFKKKTSASGLCRVSTGCFLLSRAVTHTAGRAPSRGRWMDGGMKGWMDEEMIGGWRMILLIMDG